MTKIPKVGDFLIHYRWNLVKVVKEYSPKESICQVFCFLPVEKRMLLHHELVVPFAEERSAPAEGIGCAQCKTVIRACAQYLFVDYEGDKDCPAMRGVMCSKCWGLIMEEVTKTAAEGQPRHG
jgi:hypothetical protein